MVLVELRDLGSQAQQDVAPFLGSARDAKEGERGERNSLALLRVSRGA